MVDTGWVQGCDGPLRDWLTNHQILFSSVEAPFVPNAIGHGHFHDREMRGNGRQGGDRGEALGEGAGD